MMIAMQYSFVLPADYDMSIIDRRIADKGRFTDGLPDLVFKAYLNTRKTAMQGPESENRYAPFYLWESASGMNDFLSGPGFVAVTQSFGWPSVKTWSVWHAEMPARIADARFATRELIPIRPHAPLGELRASATGHARAAVEKHGALASVVGFEPTTWSIVRFQLWDRIPPPAVAGPFESLRSAHEPAHDYCLYAVGHVSSA